MTTEQRRPIVTYAKRNRRPAPAQTEDAAPSPARAMQATPSGLLPLSAVSPALKRIWQQRPTAHPMYSTKSSTTPAFARVKLGDQPRTPLSDHTNAPRALPNKVPTLKVNRVSPKYTHHATKPAVRTYRSRVVTRKPALDSPSSSSRSSSDDEPAPKLRKGRPKAKALVIESDSDNNDAGPPPTQRATRGQAIAPSAQSAGSQQASSSKLLSRPRDPSPASVIVISDSDDESYVPTPKKPSRGRTQQVKVTVKKALLQKSDLAPKSTSVVDISDSEASVATPPRPSVPARRLVPYVVLTPLRRAPKVPQPSAVSPMKRVFVARTATPVRAVLAPRRRAPSSVASNTSSLQSVESLPLPTPPSPALSTSEEVAYLKPLLHECGQVAPYDFASLLETLPFDETLLARVPMARRVFRKLGEASYSEVFAIGDVVLKVVPLRDEESLEDENAEWTLPDVSDTNDVLREVVMTREIGALCNGFTKLITAYVVSGTYPERLLKLWDDYQRDRGSESIRPDGFASTQAYAILVQPNLGTDLEAFVFKPTTGWAQACAIFWQVAQSLADAEQRASFEHRDLHWGQILVQRVQGGDHDSLDSEAHGVRATIIDLGLSRMQLDAGSAPQWTTFAEEIFEGTGDYQFDVYRLMRTYNGGNWTAFNPMTNVMWLHYLAVKLTQNKCLRKPRTANELLVAKYLLETVDILASSISLFGTKRKVRKGSVQMLKSASDVVEWARERKWLL